MRKLQFTIHSADLTKRTIYVDVEWEDSFKLFNLYDAWHYSLLLVMIL